MMIILIGSPEAAIRAHSSRIDRVLPCGKSAFISRNDFTAGTDESNLCWGIVRNDFYDRTDSGDEIS